MPVGSVLAVATQFQRLAGDSGVLQLAEQTIQAVFRQFDQAEGLADLDAANGFARQTALVEDRAQQVLRSDAITSAQCGTATHAPLGQRHRRTTLAVFATLAATVTITLATLTRGANARHQRLLALDAGQIQRLAVGGLLQQRSGQGTRA